MAWKDSRKGAGSSLEDKIEQLTKAVSVIDSRFTTIESRLDRMSDLIESGTSPQGRTRAVTERIFGRAEHKGEQTERFSERIEQAEQLISSMSAQDLESSSIRSRINIGSIHGRHREILAMLINGGFHTYKEMADKLSVSQSRVRAYIAELRNKYNIPLRQVRDAEGYKIGVEMRFVEEILSSSK